MTLSEFKTTLSQLETINFTLPDGKKVPAHFHITEVGEITRNFIDCGGTQRLTKRINFQLWEDADLSHRLSVAKLLRIIKTAEEVLFLGNHPIEVEYQTSTISKYGLTLGANGLELTALQTDCLAPELCALPKNEVSDVNTCTPGSGCC